MNTLKKFPGEKDLYFRYQMENVENNSRAIHSFNKPVELVYYDQLANQIDPIFLTVRREESWELSSNEKQAKELVSPIEYCIKTKWTESVVDWNGSDPLL